MLHQTEKLIAFFFSLILIVGLTPYVFAGGSGSEETDILFINNNYYKIKLETNPAVLDGTEDEIIFNILTINDDTQEIIDNVQYNIEIFDNNENLLVSFEALSPENKLNTRIIPSNSLNIVGDKSQNGIWIGTADSPLIIEGPIFLEGGLVKIVISIHSINSKIVTDYSTFEILYTMGEYIPFSVDIHSSKTDLKFATYFDRIDAFYFDESKNKITAEMPFNWKEDFIKSIPFVHAEYYIPKTVDIFDKHEILLSVNDIPFFGTIDRSGDEIVVHFLLSSSKLLKMIEDVPSNQLDKMIFGIESGKLREETKKDASLENGEKSIILSSEEDWKFHLSLTPKGKINPDVPIILSLEFHDPVTNSLISQITYDLDVFLNGINIMSDTREALSGKDDVRIIFDKTGSVIIRLSNVNNFDTTGEFSFKVSKPKIEFHESDYAVDIALNSSIPGCEENNSCYLPNTLQISVNEQVLWNNQDNSAHTVTSGNPEEGFSGLFDSQIIAPGETFSFKFENPGSFDYFCTLHPWMIGIVNIPESESLIPQWIKNNASWWSEGQINDDDFAKGLEYLIKEKIVDIPDELFTQDATSTEIPQWLRSNASWWSQGMLSDSEFLKGIEWMVSNGIIRI